MPPPIWSLNTPLPSHQHFSVQGPKRVFTPFQHPESCIHTCSDYWSQPAHAFISRALLPRYAGNVNVSIWRVPNPLSSYKREVLNPRSTEEPGEKIHQAGEPDRQGSQNEDASIYSTRLWCKWLLLYTARHLIESQ